MIIYEYLRFVFILEIHTLLFNVLLSNENDFKLW